MNPFKKKKKKVDIIDSETSELLATSEIEVDERGIPISKAQPSQNPTEREPSKEDVIEAQQDVIADLRAKLEVVSDREFERQKEDLAKEGIDVSNITEPEQLEQAKKELQAKRTGRSAGKGASGSSTLEGQLRGSNPHYGEKAYPSYGAMIRDLRKSEKSPNPEVSERATAILNALFKKAMLATEKGKMRLPSEIKGISLEEQKEMLEKSKIPKRFYKDPRRPQKKESD